MKNLISTIIIKIYQSEFFFLNFSYHQSYYILYFIKKLIIFFNEEIA
jgi:hypothetical protein